MQGLRIATQRIEKGEFRTTIIIIILVLPASTNIIIFVIINKGPLNPYVSRHRNSDSFSSMKSESLQLCTEGLGFESCDDVEDVHNEIKDDWENQEERVTRHSPRENAYTEFRRSRTQGGAFPPPISCIGKSGKPWVSFKSYRHDGRFVLKEIRIPNQELLHACREDGRLKLHFNSCFLLLSIFTLNFNVRYSFPLLSTTVVALSMLDFFRQCNSTSN
ncbi:unnamed protein product, partial [Vitis vinifera]